MLDEYIAHGDLLLNNILYSEDELYHWKLGFSMPNHKWIERLGTPGHYIYKYADDLHEALTGDKAQAFYSQKATEYGKAAYQAKTAAENEAAAAIVAQAMGKRKLAAQYHESSLSNKGDYEQYEKYATAYQRVVEDINDWPINRFRRGVKEFVDETAARFSDLVNKGNDFLQNLFGKKKPKPRPTPSRPDRPHSRVAKKAFGVAHPIKKGRKIRGMEGWGNITGQQLMDAAAKKRAQERRKQRQRAQREAAKWLKDKD